jgi:hypothetical protein
VFVYFEFTLAQLSVFRHCMCFGINKHFMGPSVSACHTFHHFVATMALGQVIESTVLEHIVATVSLV